MTLHVRNSGVWQEVSQPYVRDAGTWKPLKEGWVRDAGTWKRFYRSLTVTPPTVGATRSSDATTVYAGMEFRNDGTLWRNSNAGTTSFSLQDATDWLTQGTAAEVWIERVISSGTLGWLDAGAGRLQLSTSRFYGVSDSVINGTPVVCEVTFNFYNASTGGDLLGTTGVLTLSANKEPPA